MNWEFIAYLIASLIFGFAAGKRTGYQIRGFMDKTIHGLINRGNERISQMVDLRFKNDELLMDNQILANKVKRLENSNAQLQRRPRA